ncbi:MAG: isoprenyl transferase [[Eubacterium] brachy]|jgi:di-trans,poly-cis-decaprenylcistransferase|nr:di-trans,poly-cis-decaprenylcistransferase [Eubacterium brachy ATCC 33089]MBF1134042.1 isoprenyl transferase [[Eubacterium] brachy]
MLDMNNIPSSVAIIMDGNGRWAEKRRLPRVMGHNAGMKAMREIVSTASQLGVKFLTVYAFSTENWNRSDEEINGIFKLLIKYVDSELDKIAKNNVKINILGDRERLAQKVNEKIEQAIKRTEKNDGLIFNIALNYGGRDEILRSVKSVCQEVKSGVLQIDDIDAEKFEKHLYTGELGVKDPDLIIRTSGEIRISNFLLWQLAYSEMIFVDVLWPDFTPDIFKKTIMEYQRRSRRFGGR